MIAGDLKPRIRFRNRLPIQFSKSHAKAKRHNPPIGLNQVRTRINIEGVPLSIDLIDMEVPAVVAIEPGHGGMDSGAVGAGNVQEKDLALTYRLSLNDELKERFSYEKRGLRCVMTRNTTDSFLSLVSRPRLAGNTGADVFVSIHFNSSSGSGRGTETFVERTSDEASGQNDGNNVNVDDDLILAGALNVTAPEAVAAFDSEGGFNRDVKRAGLAVTRNGKTYNGNDVHYSPVKACLIEVEFLTNPVALKAIELSSQSGISIKNSFGNNGALNVYNNVRDQK